jgi:peptide/nickel transport system substrate-binding protein
VLGVSPERALNGLLGGEFQLIQSRIRLLEEHAGSTSGIEVFRQASIMVQFLRADVLRDVTPFCDVRPNPFKNPLVREAVDLALDRQELVRSLPNRAVPASQPVSTPIFGFDPGIPVTSHDLERARTLLSEAGLGAGFDVTMHVRRIHEAAGGLVARQLAAVGIRTSLAILEDPEYFSLLRRLGATLWLGRYGCETGDAGVFLDQVVHSKDPSRGLGMANYGDYANQDLDRAIEEIALAADATARKKALQGAIRMVVAERVWIPLYSEEEGFALRGPLAWRPRLDGKIRVAEIGAPGAP